MTDEKRPLIPTEPVKQLCLFSNFLENPGDELSNTVEIWHSIPKYIVTPAEANKLRNPDGTAQPFEHLHNYKDREGNDVSMKVVIHPALIQQEDGSYKAFFPNASEEIMEEVLKKIFIKQNYGIHNAEKKASWVKFSKSMLRNELAKRNHGRTYKAISHTLEVMSMCNISVFKDGKKVYSGGIISEYVAVDRKEYIKDTDTFHYARLPVFISEGINTLQYRQFNYKKLMCCKGQLSRWLYHRMINNYTQASILNTYHIAFTTIKSSSGLLMSKDDRRNRLKIINALEELKTEQVITTYKIKETMLGRKIVDVIYTITPHYRFEQEQKAANKRHNENEIEAYKVGIIRVTK